MGSRVMFRGRDARGIARTGPTYYEPELSFIKYEPSDIGTEVGDGTAFCMRVTPKQLAALLYKVKETQFDELSFSGEIDTAASTITLDFIFPGLVANEDQRYFDETSVWSRIMNRGGFITDGYGETEEIFLHALGRDRSNFSDSYEMGFARYADMENELGRFAYGNGESPHIGAFNPPPPTSSRRITSVGYFQASPPPNSYPYAYYQFYDKSDSSTTDGHMSADIFAVIGTQTEASPTRCAYIDNAGNGDPFDPANELWLEASIGATADFSIEVRSLKSSTLTMTEVGEYQFDFGEGSILDPVTVKLYGGAASYTISTNPINMTQRATEWWPYAKVDGTDFYDVNTGNPV